MNWKLFTKCNACKKWSLLIRKCVIQLPTGHKATLKEKLLCPTCITKTRNALEKKI